MLFWTCARALGCSFTCDSPVKKISQAADTSPCSSLLWQLELIQGGSLHFNYQEVWGEGKTEKGFELFCFTHLISWELQRHLDGLAHLPAYWHNPNDLQNSSMSPHLRGSVAFSSISMIFILFIYDIIFMAIWSNIVWVELSFI